MTIQAYLVSTTLICNVTGTLELLDALGIINDIGLRADHQNRDL